MHIPQLSYPFICQWTFRLLPHPSCCKQCCDEHWGTRVSFSSGFPGVSLQFWYAFLWWLVRLSIFSLPLGHLHTFFGEMACAHFLIGLFVFLILIYTCCLSILEINRLTFDSFTNIFFHPEGCLSSCLWFTLLCKSFYV